MRSALTEARKLILGALAIAAYLGHLFAADQEDRSAYISFRPLGQKDARGRGGGEIVFASTVKPGGYACILEAHLADRPGEGAIVVAYKVIIIAAVKAGAAVRGSGFHCAQGVQQFAGHGVGYPRGLG